MDKQWLLEEQCRQMIEQLEALSWMELGPNAQLGVIRFIKYYAAAQLVSKDQSEYLGQLAFHKFVAVPGHDEERWKALLRLTSEQEIIRSLCFRPAERKGPIRFAGEELYPTTGWLGQYLEWCQGSESPLGYHFWLGVGLLGAAAKRRIWINRNAFDNYLNQLIVLVHTSGGKKSHALTVARMVADSMNAQLLEMKGPKWLERGLLPWEDPMIHFLKEDTTPEAIPRDLAELQINPICAIEGAEVRIEHQEAVAVWTLTEMGALFNKDNFNVGRTFETVLQFADNPKEYGVSRVQRKAIPPRRICLSLWGCTTPDWIRHNFTKSHLFGGFGSRFLFIYRSGINRDRQYPDPDPLDGVWRDKLAKELIEISLGAKRTMILTRDAREFYEYWYRTTLVDLKIQTIPEMVGWYHRKDDHLMRLAATLALSEGENYYITLSSLQKALQILDDEERRLPECFKAVFGHPESEEIQKVYDAIPKTGEESLSVIRQKANLPSRITQNHLNTLRKEGMARRVYKKGRSERWVRIVDRPLDDVTG